MPCVFFVRTSFPITRLKCAADNCVVLLLVAVLVCSAICPVRGVIIKNNDTCTTLLSCAVNGTILSSTLTEAATEDCCARCTATNHCVASTLTSSPPQCTLYDRVYTLLPNRLGNVAFVIDSRTQAPPQPSSHEGHDGVFSNLSVTVSLLVLCVAAVLLLGFTLSQWRRTMGPYKIGKYEMLREIGSGAYSTVYLVRRLRDGELFALKLVKCRTDESQADCTREYRTLLRLRGHQPILEVVDVLCSNGSATDFREVVLGLEGALLLPRSRQGSLGDPHGINQPPGPHGNLNGDDPDPPRSGRRGAPSSGSRPQTPTNNARFVAIVTSYYPEGSLQHYLVQRNMDRAGPIEQATVLEWGAQIASALSYMHSKGVIHRDLKPGNILMAGNGKRVVIADLGLSRMIDEEYIHTKAGTLQYMAPEQVERVYTSSVDVWSLGCVLYACFTRKVQNPHLRTMYQFRRQSNFEEEFIRDMTEAGASNNVVVFLLLMLSISPQQRPSAAQVVESLQLLLRRETSRDGSG